VELPLPPHWAPGRVEEVWRVPYEERAADAEEWAREHRIGPSRDDAGRICLLVVDVQNTFCTSGFELFVPGAPDDNRRLCEFVYRNLGRITQVVPTLDTHRAAQIFHPAWLVDVEGRHPLPYTVVSTGDVERGLWRAADPAHQEQLLSYVRELEAGGRYRLTVWPYHAMLGGIGHALVSAVEEAVFFHGLARESQPAFQIKGDDPSTEHYSVLGPEVGEERNAALLELLGGFDAIAIAGQATALPGRSTTYSTTSACSPSACTCSRTAPRQSSSPAWSTSPRKPMPRSRASRPPGCTWCARPIRSKAGRDSPQPMLDPELGL
jgi:nicotinamidase-related amidase